MLSHAQAVDCPRSLSLCLALALALSRVRSEHVYPLQIAGNILGGKAGDWLASKFPDTGRIMLALGAVLCSTACAVIVLLLIPLNPSNGVGIGFVFAIFGFFGQGYSGGANNPMLAAVSPPELRSTVMAWAYAFEIAGAALLGPPLVGFIAQEGFGYIPSQEVDITLVPDDQRATNASALRYGLLFVSVLPFSLASVLYCFVAFTYPRERDAQLQYMKSPI